MKNIYIILLIYLVSCINKPLYIDNKCTYISPIPIIEGGYDTIYKYSKIISEKIDIPQKYSSICRDVVDSTKRELFFTLIIKRKYIM